LCSLYPSASGFARELNLTYSYQWCPRPTAQIDVISATPFLASSSSDLPELKLKSPTELRRDDRPVYHLKGLATVGQWGISLCYQSLTTRRSVDGLRCRIVFSPWSVGIGDAVALETCSEIGLAVLIAELPEPFLLAVSAINVALGVTGKPCRPILGILSTYHVLSFLNFAIIGQAPRTFTE